ncbi:NUDIX domain-containing protein [Sphingomonas sp. TDK1]|uniref:NUDIX domain-containing protein n=1 Tax=Sphingomonas sp. TDK1 TaxID=453247 RepID=UPI0007D8F213|nr:NUDIX hydrolase [Sphingomonas sp. TDK1]OAN66068.1 NUDIX hydrolase [Sphingomonas sp. TDK1]
MSGSEPGHRIESVETVFEGWGRMLLATLRTPDGSRITRQIEDHGDAVGVLPYDADRGTVLLVRQSRPPLIFRGDTESVFEVLAGRIDPGEEAEESVRREAVEECGVTLGTIILVGHFFSMPAVSTERLSLYLAPYSRADRTSAGGGLADDHEDIEVIEMRLDDLWAMGMGALADMKTAVLVLALRERLAAQAWPPAA